MPQLNFIKMHGNGNDFVIIDMREIQYTLDIELLTHRKLGIGCDQLITLHNSTISDCALKIYNADGSFATMCGNALRCVAALYLEKSAYSSCILSIETKLFKCCMLGDNLVQVELEAPKFLSLPSALGSLLNLNDYCYIELVDVGNPHLILFTNPSSKVDINQIGLPIEKSLDINISVVTFFADNNLFIETWERGSGPTLSCGSAACAAVVAAINTKQVSTNREIKVTSRGGFLLIKWLETTSLLMTGKIKKVYSGQLH